MSTIPLQRSQRHCLQAPGDLLIPDGSSITIAYQSARVLVAATLPQDYRHIVQQLIYILLSFRMFLFPQFAENLHELNPFPVDFNQCSAWSTESKHIGTPHTHATYIHLCAHILYTNAHGCLRAVHRGTPTNTSTHLSSFSIAMHHILFYYILCFSHAYSLPFPFLHAGLNHTMGQTFMADLCRVRLQDQIGWSIFKIFRGFFSFADSLLFS